MSIIIRGMNMPKDGDVLMVRKDDDGKIYIKESHTWGYSAELIELPEEHGRLIDAGALTHLMGMDEHFPPLEAIYLMGLIADAPTIIEAEVGKE